MSEQGTVTATPVDASHANGALFAALAKAQEQAQTVKKEGRNTQGRYLYAEADDMIAAGREARRGTGLSLLTTWALEEASTPGEYGNQWVSHRVAVHWVLAHSDGGYLTGAAYVDAVASRGRPPDKAIAAALTYAEGFVERGLMRLDRDENPEDVDQRQEPTQAPRQQADRTNVKDCKTVAELESFTKRYAAASAEKGLTNQLQGAVLAQAKAAGLEVTDADVRGWLGVDESSEEAA